MGRGNPGPYPRRDPAQRPAPRRALLPPHRPQLGPPPPAGAIVYGSRRASKLKKQLHILKARPSAVVIFDQTNNLPILSVGGHNLHIDQKKPTTVQVERDGWPERIKFMARWIPSAIRCTIFARTVKPYKSTTRYG